MNIIIAGISHKTASIEVREKLFLRIKERELLLSNLKNEAGVVSAIVLSTCNRTEIYAHLIDDNPLLLLQHLFKVKKMNLTKEWGKHFYIHKQEAAVRHLFNVACGLDSLVIGESQILGQVKTAADSARNQRMMDKVFNILLNVAIHGGKLVKTRTDISFGGSSVSWAAVAMANQALESLEGKNVLIIGAGKMSQLTAGQLSRRSIANVFVMNRTLDKAKALAQQIGGHAVALWDMKDVLSHVDVCICSAGAPHYLLERALIRDVMAQRQSTPLLLIDISTPRNIDPAVADLPDVQLISMDDLNNIIIENIEKRRSAIESVERIIERKVSAFYDKISKVKEREFELQTI
jgi:glutamyl-tRNA reductase